MGDLRVTMTGEEGKQSVWVLQMSQTISSCYAFFPKQITLDLSNSISMHASATILGSSTLTCFATHTC